MELDAEPFSCRHIGNNIFPNGIMKFQLYRRFIFPDWNSKVWNEIWIIPFEIM
jgi:hypothetical protein